MDLKRSILRKVIGVKEKPLAKAISEKIPRSKNKAVTSQPNQGKMAPPSRSKPKKPTPRLSVKGKRTVGNSMAQISPTAPRRAPIQKSLPKKRSTSRSVELNPRVHHGHDQVGKDVAQDKEEGGYGQGSHDHRLISA